MAEYRNRTTGEVKTQGQWKAEYSNMSLPRVWKSATLDALDLDPVLRSPEATVGQYQISVRDGVEQNSNGDWVEKYVVRDMFSDDVDLGTKAEQEARHQEELDRKVAENVRSQRDRLLAETDWVAIRARELGQPVPDDWYTYRGDLRQIPEQDGFPHNVTWPTKPS